MAENNLQRARRAEDALTDYSDPEDERTCLIDLLTDLMHLCRVRGHCFESALSMARMHFEAEQ